MKKIKFKKYLSIIITFIFIILFFFYFKNHLSDFKKLSEIRLSTIIFIASLQALGLILNSVFLILILKIYGKEIRFKDSFFVTTTTSIVNFFTPFQGGLGFRAIYLKKKYDFTYKNFIYITAANYIIVFLISSMCTLVAIQLLRLNKTFIDTKITISFIIIFILMIMLILLSKLKLNNNLSNKLLFNLEKVLKGWRLLIQDKKIFLSLFVLSFLTFLVSILLNYFELRAIGVRNMNISLIIIYSSISSMSLLLGFTPGSIGIKESILILIKDSFLISTSQIIASSIVDRGIYFFVMLILLFIIRFKYTKLNFIIKN